MAGADPVPVQMWQGPTLPHGPFRPAGPRRLPEPLKARRPVGLWSRLLFTPFRLDVPNAALAGEVRKALLSLQAIAKQRNNAKL